MRHALEYATGLGALVAQHAEEPRLTAGAVAHEGPTAGRLGLAGWPRAASIQERQPSLHSLSAWSMKSGMRAVSSFVRPSFIMRITFMSQRYWPWW